jgi:hypothetical protein
MILADFPESQEHYFLRISCHKNQVTIHKLHNNNRIDVGILDMDLLSDPYAVSLQMNELMTLNS